MRRTALEFAAKGKLVFRDLGEPPQAGPAQILIETRYTGITNGTERHAFLAEHGYGEGKFPSRHGYQQVGRIVAAGKKVVRFKIGDWVFYGDYVGHCGWNLTDETGLLLKLPRGMDYKHAALFGVAAVALRSVRRMGVGLGDNVWVAGQGPIGHFTGQAARAAGARVTVTDVIAKRLDAAKQCGAHVVLNAAQADTEQLLEQGGPYGYIFDCCSVKDLLFDVHRLGLLNHGGTVAMMAVRDTACYPWSLLHGTEARIETSCHFTVDDLRVLLFLYERGLVKIASMISHVVAIDEAPVVYDRLAHRGEEVLGVIFDWAESFAGDTGGRDPCADLNRNAAAVE